MKKEHGKQQKATFDTTKLIDRMAQQLRAQLETKQIENPVMVGIHTAGVWIARRLHESLGLQSKLGELNISFHRDDFGRIGLHPQIKPSRLPASLENKHIILVDDVLYTGRTVRAAMNELFDYGRPASILLVVLIDRGGRELPIEAQVVGCKDALDAQSRYQITEEDNELKVAIVPQERN